MLEEVTMSVPPSTTETTPIVDTSILDTDEKEEKAINTIKNSSKVFDDLPKTISFATKRQNIFSFIIFVVAIYTLHILYIP